MPAIFSCKRPSEALLHHVRMQQVDLREVHAPEAHACYAFMAVALAAALKIDLPEAVYRVYLEIVSAVVVPDSRPSEIVQQPVPVAVEDEPERLFLIVSDNDVVYIAAASQMQREPPRCRERLSASRRPLGYVERVSKWAEDERLLLLT